MCDEWDDFEELTYNDIISLVEELYEDNEGSPYVVEGDVIFRYKNQYVKISVYENEDLL